QIVLREGCHGVDDSYQDVIRNHFGQGVAGDIVFAGVNRPPHDYDCEQRDEVVDRPHQKVDAIAERALDADVQDVPIGAHGNVTSGSVTDDCFAAMRDGQLWGLGQALGCANEESADD